MGKIGLEGSQGGMEAALGCLGVIQVYLHITLYAPWFS